MVLEDQTEKNTKKAIVTLIGKFFVIIYTMLKQSALFDESCVEVGHKNYEQKQFS